MKEEQEKQEEEPRKPKRRKMVEVYVVSQKGQSALVQWGGRDDLHRGYVPAVEIEDGKVDKAVLDAAIPYGVPWEELIDLSELTPQKVAQELHRAGVWTAVDIDARRKQAKQALVAAIGASVSLNALREVARELEKKEA